MPNEKNPYVATTETWKEWPEATGYFVSDHGRVRGPSGKLLVTKFPSNRYCVFGIRRGGRKAGLKLVPVHLAVLRMFVREPVGHEEGRHLDDNKNNNHVENLRWGSVKDNAADRTRNGNTLRGDRNGHAKLKWSDVEEIKRELIDGVSSSVLAARFNVSTSTIYLIYKGKTWAAR
jgi:hypothetical protein